MGNYVFHFDDGSEALAHYGKKGMHWGEWNEETRERYLNEGKLPDFPVPSGIGGKFGKSITETDVPGGVYRLGSDGEYYLDKEATERQWHANKKSEFAEKTNQDYDPRTGGVYSKTVSGAFARTIDNIIADPGGTLERVARNVLKNGKNLVDSALGALDKVSKTVKTEARYLTEGYTPTVRTDANKATKKFYNHRLPSVNKVNYVKPRPGSWTQEELDKANNIDYQGYRKSTARKVRNFFGQE